MAPVHLLARWHRCMPRSRPRTSPSLTLPPLLAAALWCSACEGQSASATPSSPASTPTESEPRTALESDAPHEPASSAPSPVQASAGSANAAPAAVADPAASASKSPRFDHADLDPDNDAQIGPPPALDDCEARLEAAGVAFDSARIGVGRERDGVYTCGAHQVVRVRKGPGEIRYSSKPLLTCQMALALADFERVLQEEAQRHLGRRVTRIDHLGTYNCREMANYDLISEHSFANAIDLRRFHLEGGGTVDVLDDFAPQVSPPPDEKAAFMRALAQRLYDEAVFSNVLTPYFDRIHRNHIHVDLARYRTDGTRP